MATKHINAEKGDFAKVVLMPGDPKRAKWIVDNFLHDVKLVNEVRGCLAFTGYTRNNVRISVMASGMGMPSIGIYSYELYTEFGVETIIRVGTCGAYQEDINFFDILVGNAASSDSNYLGQVHLPGHLSVTADFGLVEETIRSLNERRYSYKVGNILSSDIFYDLDPNAWKKWADLGVLGVEMEAYALYIQALRLKKRALCLLTVTDHFLKEGNVTAEERQTGLFKMIDVACNVAEKYA